MFNFSFPVLLSILLGLSSSSVQCFSHRQGPFHISTSKNAEENHLDFTLEARNSTLLLARIGLGVPSAVGIPSECPRPDPDSICMEWGDFAQVHFNWVSHPDCIQIQTTSSFARELEDCFDLDIQPPVHWYGGGETHTQTWPIENNPRELSPFVTGDFLQSPQYFYGGVVENYFVLSSGVALKIDDKTPLYVSVNTTRPNRLCLVARDHSPYTKRDKLQLTYDICTLNNPKEAHQHAIKTFWGQPDSLPDERMLIQPFWSTWAEYKEQVNEQVVLEFARKVISEGFINSSHIEIDDHWETCYGEEEFDPVKFPNPRRMVDEIKSMHEMRVTAWVHPFINEDCPKFQEGLDKSYFVQSTKPRTGLTWWWQGRRNAGLIDVTNPEAAKWWSERLQKLQNETGLTSFKFDAGEVNWLPASSNLNNDTNSDLWPQLYTTAYVETVAQFGGMIETRVAKLNQKSPTFVRMLDKDSRWGYDNGLRSMIPTLLHMGIVGYPFVLPDMIGGNAYGGEVPSQELYVRWMQVNIFMPAVQFSLAPWRIGESEEERRETVRLCLKVLEEREKYAGLIIQAARQATVDGSPINRPMWWADPENRETFTIDDQYMLGDSIVVAPVVIEGQRTRDIYLPSGTWISGVDGQTHSGPTWLTNYPVPLDVVPFFVKG